MGLTVIPYRVRTAVNSDLNQRFRRLHMRAPLRSLIAPMPIEYSPALQINARSLRNRQTNFPSSTEVDQRQFRRQSLLSSPFLVTEDIRRINIALNQNRALSTNTLNQDRALSTNTLNQDRALPTNTLNQDRASSTNILNHQRSRSNAK